MERFKVTDITGKTFAVPGSKRGYTLLVFLRYAGCPWCNLAIYRLSLEYERLQKLDCEVVAFVQSDETSIKENIYDRHTPHPQFPIISDKVMKYYDLFKVDSSVAGTFRQITKIPYWLQAVYGQGFKQGKLDGDLFLVPGWFLISNLTGEIIRSARGVSFYNHETFVSIYDSLTFKD